MELNLLDKKSGTMVREYMPDTKTLELLADFFSAFSDATRIKILTALAMSPMCVGDLSIVLGINQTTLSHQLKFLRSAKLVKFKRQGKVVFYELEEANTVDEVMCMGVDYLGK